MSDETAIELKYHGTPMKVEPRNISMDSARATLRNFQPVYCVLEPGDGTRYEVVVMYMRGYGYMFCRVDRGEDKVRGVYLSDHYHPDELIPAAGRNDWTLVLLDWWLRQLLGMKPYQPTPEEVV